ncbi:MULTISPECIES: hypothetical protein [Variovorax]|uniref:hypothetical protein n=1 Tax=Variovorax TaxID=34072 RepID=UPI00285505A8|nr:hypothetical protein [Variovorax sp. 3319]MDR6886103.1 hypothetical protein [Variovorax sp. 3319]
MNGQVEFKPAAHDDGGPAFPISDPQSTHATAMAASIHIEDPVERERAYILARAAAVIGMTLRDYFAAQALPAVVASASWRDLEFKPVNGLSAMENNALCAYQQADAMLKVRSA